MNNIATFYFGDAPINFLAKDDEAWIPLALACKYLDIQDIKQAGGRIPAEDKVLYKAQTRGGAQNVVFINMGAFIELALTSRKPEAIAFKRWVTHEVIPSIYVKGGYISDKATKEQVAQLTKEYEAKVVQLTHERDRAKHSADATHNTLKQLTELHHWTEWHTAYDYLRNVKEIKHPTPEQIEQLERRAFDRAGKDYKFAVLPDRSSVALFARSHLDEAYEQ